MKTDLERSPPSSTAKSDTKMGAQRTNSGHMNESLATFPEQQNNNNNQNNNQNNQSNQQQQRSPSNESEYDSNNEKQLQPPSNIV